MIMKYIKPITGVIVNVIEVPILAGSDDGNHHAAKQFIDSDNWDDSSDEIGDQWPKQKSLWDE